MFKAFFNPKPVANGYSARQSQGRQNRNGPRRRKKEQINQQDNGRNRMEAEIYHHISSVAVL